LTPRARAARIEGVVEGQFKVAVTAPASENQANEALLRFLAREWRLPQRDLSIVGGAKNRNKTIHIAGEAAALMARLTAVVDALQPR
jgi:uncharacterized protein (TIGR00251 family)